MDRTITSQKRGDVGDAYGRLPCILNCLVTIENVQVIAVAGRIREIMRLYRQYGSARWRKLKGIATVRLQTGRICRAEVHWYEAHGKGRKKLKIKRILG